MRRFNYKEVFEKFFPSYYKENDSYKDSQGRGLLERLITICTEYFDTDVVTNSTNPGLDDFIDLIDFDKTPDIFLNYLWEYLGEIPYAWGIITNGQPYTKENLEDWLSSPKGYPRADSRRALKYAISLYKIRGTILFYELLGKLYGVQFDLVDHLTGVHIFEGEYVKATYGDIFSTYPSDVDPEGITFQYPLYEYQDENACKKCIPLEIYIKIPEGMYESMINSSPAIDLENVKQAFKRVVEKYLPIFCQIAKDNDGNDLVYLESYDTILIVR